MDIIVTEVEIQLVLTPTPVEVMTEIIQIAEVITINVAILPREVLQIMEDLVPLALAIFRILLATTILVQLEVLILTEIIILVHKLEVIMAIILHRLHLLEVPLLQAVAVAHAVVAAEAEDLAEAEEGKLL